MAFEQVNIFVNGIVQGVGFRPFVYRLAHELSLTGSVLNDHRGVSIVLQGEPTNINHFLHQLEHSPPPLARIDAIKTDYHIVEQPIRTFSIIESDKGNEHAIVALSADKSTCQDCLAEMHDPTNRHYQYPFTNCTNCGPRYSIINALPYDRHNTSMAGFDMCDQCAAAYTNPMDRRYHAQPVSCPNCGPKLSLQLVEHQLEPFTFSVHESEQQSNQQVIKQTAKLLAQGKIIAIKGLGGFHLICDATNSNAVNLLRQRKQRPAKPLAVMVNNLVQAQTLVQGTQAEWDVLSSAEKPITVMQKKSAVSELLSDAVAPQIDRLGLFLPYTPLHVLLMAAFNRPIVATSANRSGEPIICDGKQLLDNLGHVIDAMVDHDRPIINACDDSVVQVINGQLQVIRLARGYAPLTLPTGNIKLQNNTVLAVGGQQKNAVAFGFDRNLILSPHIGNLYSLEAQMYFERSLATFKRLYDFTPSTVISDKHPDYAPSRWAQQYCQQHKTVKQQQVQHHYSHILATMAANQYQQTVLGFSYDGTGLGDDGSLWGSEVMLADTQGYRTLAHFTPFKLIGGEQAIKQPVRILLALLFAHFSLADIRRLPIHAINQLSDTQLTNLHILWKNTNHGVYCRSVGRLFDALAVALNLIQTNQFEGQAGMLVEAQAALNQHALIASSFQNKLTIKPIIDNSTGITQWDSQDLFKQIIDTIQTGENQPQLQQALCDAFIQAIANASLSLAQQYPQYPLVFSGGVFQNKCLLSLCLTQAKQNHHQVLPSHQVPINDGGLALGQLWYSIHQNSL